MFQVKLKNYQKKKKWLKITKSNLKEMSILQDHKYHTLNQKEFIHFQI